MKKIVGILRPFDLYQTFYVYEDGNEIHTEQMTIDEIANKVVELANKYDINQIDLSGAKQYAVKIQKDICEKELTQYNKNELVIQCI